MNNNPPREVRAGSAKHPFTIYVFSEGSAPETSWKSKVQTSYILPSALACSHKKIIDGVVVLSTKQAEDLWGQCQRTDGYHPYCACTYKDRPEVHYYAAPKEEFFVPKGVEEAKALGKSIVVVEDLS